LGERLLCKQEVIGSIPFTSTRFEGEIAGCKKELLPEEFPREITSKPRGLLLVF
jgi:hypothetical protein